MTPLWGESGVVVEGIRTRQIMSLLTLQKDLDWRLTTVAVVVENLMNLPASHLKSCYASFLVALVAALVDMEVEVEVEVEVVEVEEEVEQFLQSLMQVSSLEEGVV